MKATLRSTALAAMLLAPLAATLVVQPAQAAPARVAMPKVTNMSVNSDSGLTPGATLRLQVYATPNARRTTVTLGDGGPTVHLRQQTAGNYAGSYVVRRSDRIDPTTLMTARVTFGDRVYSRQFNFPPSFQALAAMGAAPAAPAHALAIERFVMRPMGRLEPGRELRFRLVGEPGGDAWMDIPGVIRGVDLSEVRPGVYEGTYTIRRRDDLDAFRNAVATLRSGNQRVTARVDVRGDDREVRDERPPQITELTPANGERIGERGRTHVRAHLSDEGSGIDPATVRLRLNGRDVTADARVTPDELHYRADLDPGRYNAELTVRDQAGNASTKSWSFDVMPDRVGGAGSVELPLQVTSHSNNMVVDTAGNLSIQGRTAPYANVRVQVDAVASVAGLLGLTQPVADQTVQADRNGHFAVALAPRGGLPIPGTRYDVHVTATSGSQTAEERLTLIQRQG
ncbi:hypothetical protein [Ramlibacter sp. AN1133]|uniref:hypothetical protein n=1 Tax=Ramlibacter sp. AN1133 TaxID=3133429 RepID=UPI0030BBF285